MDLMVISNPVSLQGELKFVNQLFEAGLQIFHLRKPGLSLLQCRKFIAEIDEAYHDRIALHQFHSLVSDFAIRRIHYPEKLRQQEKFKKEIFKSNPSNNLSNLILSTSIHHLSDLNNTGEFDYTFFGPVFNSLSKPGYTGNINEDFKLPKSTDRAKVIALGGINEGNIDKLRAMNFDGIALLGAIWNNPLQAVNTFKNIQKNVSTEALCN